MDRQRETGAEARAGLLRGFLARVEPSAPDLTAALDAAAVQAVAALEAAGVRPLLLKGAALRQQLYAAGDRRRYSDVDLLVAPADRERTRETLSALGYRSVTGALGIDDIGGVVHAETWVGVDGDAEPGLMIDLHLWLSGSQAPAQIAWEALAARRTQISLGGCVVPVLDRAGQAMLLAMHASQHGPGYSRGVQELALALGRWPADVWPAAAGLAAEIQATAAFAAGLRLCAAGGELADTLALPATTALDWDMLHRGAQPRGTFHLQALLEARGLAGRVRVLRRGLLPSRGWIVAQYPWSRSGGARVLAAYCAHLARAPRWAARAWAFRRRRPPGTD